MSPQEIPPVSQHHVLDSVVLVLLRIFWFCFFVETVYAVILLFLISSSVGENYAFGSLTFLWIVHTLKFILEIYVLLRIVAEALTTQYYINDNKLIKYEGIFDQTESMHDLTLLKNIEVEQTWTGRHFHYGNLHITLASSGFKEEVILRGVNDPRKYERIFQTFITKE
jgi:uncharacterized membrane protein YdbT with pleckstrin-like domain